VVKHIRHVCDLAGDRLHVGIGSDFDGGFGAESIPAELDTAADLQKVGEALGDAGFSQTDIDNILGGNWVRLLRRALP
jgi:membrane dipeptidase